MNNNFLLLTPEFMVTGLAFLVLTLDFFLRENRKHLLGYAAAVGLSIILAVTLIYQWNIEDSLYDGLVVVDAYSLLFKAVFLVMGMVVVLSSVEYVRRKLSYAASITAY